MRQRVTDIIASIRTFWQNASRRTRMIILLSSAGVLVFSLVMVLIFNHVSYVLLYSGLSPQESANVLSVLGEMGVEPKISNTGAISVPDTQINRVRMQLATKGFEATAFDQYPIYTQGATLTATQADKNRAELFQTQNRLQDTIETFDEVTQAIVNISVPQQSNFTPQSSVLLPTASIKISTRPGRKLTPEQVQGIISTVRNAVSGLTDDNISIADDSGDLKATLSSSQGASVTKLGLTEQVNNTIRSRVLSVIEPAYGAEHVRVAVNSVLDTNSKVTDETTYFPFDPSDPTNNPQDYAEYDREKIGGADNAAQGVPGANDNVDVPQYPARQYNVTDGDSYIVRDVYDYLVSSVRNQIVKEGLEITDITVAVTIDADALPTGERDKIIDIVAGAAGISREHSEEKIRVQNFRFYQPPAIEILPDNTQLIRIFVISGIALLLLSMILILVFLNARKKKREELAAQAAALEAMQYDENGIPLIDLMNQEIDYEPIQMAESAELKLKAQIKDLAISDPEIVAQLIKTWLLKDL